MRRRLIPVNIVFSALLFILLSLDPDQTRPPEIVMKKGKLIYEKECMSCHLQDEATLENKLPSLAKTEWVLGPKQRLIKIVLDGFEDSIAIDGNHYQDSMPPHAHLTDQEIADLLSYVRNSFGNRASAVAAREVKKVRMEGRKSIVFNANPK